MHIARFALLLAAICSCATVALAPDAPDTKRMTTPSRLSLPPIAGVRPSGAAGASKNSIGSTCGHLPLQFEPNLGQTDPSVRFFARSRSMTAFLMGPEVVMVLFKASSPRVETAVLRVKMIGASQSARAAGFEKLPGLSNYFIGNDPARWRNNIPQYARVRFANIYPGVDVVFYGNQGRLEYDFVLSPGADASRVQLTYEGVDAIRIDRNGDLILGTSFGEIRQHKPNLYQELADGRSKVEASYVLRSGAVAIEVAGYDHRRALIIDPVLTYSSYLGGSANDSGAAVAIDLLGNVYITGSTVSADFPLVNPFQPKKGIQNVFVTRLNATGSAYVYSTYLGGAGTDAGLAIAVDSGGDAYVTGATSSSDFPTLNPVQGTLAGAQNAFIAKLNASGSQLVYSTYLGGSASDQGSGIAVDYADNAYVTGSASSTNFPTVNAFQPAMAGPPGGTDAFVTKINPMGSAYVYSTYLGGIGNDTGNALAVDGAGNVYVTGGTSSTNFPTANALQPVLGGGSDAFVTEVNAAGSALVYSTYLGGEGNDTGRAITVDSAGDAYVAGDTSSDNFPTMNALQPVRAGGSDAFVTELDATGSALVYSTYLGGSGNDAAQGITVDGAGNAYITGGTTSVNFPTAIPLQGALGGRQDAFVAELSLGGSTLVYSTYLGGSNDDAGAGITADISGDVWVAGSTSSTDFPTAVPLQASLAGGQDAFVARITSPQNQVPAVSLSGRTLVFADQLVGTGSAAQSVSLTNSGMAPLNIIKLETSGDFGQTNNCGASLAAKASCTISVSFSPKLAGVREGAVTVADNAGGTPHIIPLSGTGVAPLPNVLTLAPPNAVAGGSGFTLRVGGTGFIPGAMVNWNGKPRRTTYGNSTLLLAAIPGSDIAQPGTASITVSNPVQFGPTLVNRRIFLTGTGRGVSSTDWPQPNLILYNRQDSNLCDQIHSILPDGTGDICLTCGANGFGGGIAFHKGKLSPDGSWLLMQVTVSRSAGCNSTDGLGGTGNNQEVWLASYPNVSATQLRVSPACVAGRCGNLIPTWNSQQTRIAFGNRQTPCVAPGPPDCAMKLAVANISFPSGGSPILGATHYVDVNGANPGVVEPWSWTTAGSLVYYTGHDAIHPYPSLTVNSFRLSNNAVTVLTPWTGKDMWNEFPRPSLNGLGLFFSSSRTSPSECSVPGCPEPLFALNELNFMSLTGANARALTGLNIPGAPDYAGGVPTEANSIVLSPSGVQGLITEKTPGNPAWVVMANLAWPASANSNTVLFSVTSP